MAWIILLFSNYITDYISCSSCVLKREREREREVFICLTVDSVLSRLKTTSNMNRKETIGNNKLGLSCAKLSLSWLQAYSVSDYPNQLSWSWIELG